MMFVRSAALAAIASLASATEDYSTILKFFDERVSHADAATSCESAGAVLLYVESALEYRWVVERIGSKELWTGGKRLDDGATDASFSWTTSAAFTSVPVFAGSLPDFDADGKNDFWYKNEPNNFKSKEKCIKIKKGKLNDAMCNQKIAFACRFRPTTTTAVPSTTTTAVPSTTTTAVPSTTTTVEPTTSTTAPPTTITTVEPTTTTTLEPTTTVAPSTTTAVPSTTTTVAPSTTTTVEPTTTTEPPTTAYHPPDWDFSSESGCWFKKSDVRTDWATAASSCATMDASVDAWLATPTTEAEAKFIATLRDRAKPLWLGFKRDAGSEETMAQGDYPYSVDSWDAWYPGEPGRPISDEACIAQGLTKTKKDNEMWRLNDADCSSDFYYICQYCYDTTTTAAPTTTSTTVAPTTTTTEVPSTTTTVAPSTTTTVAPSTTTTAAPTTTTEVPTTMELPSGKWEQFSESQCFYVFVNQKEDYDGAVNECSAKFTSAGVDSHLATISTAAEAEFISTLGGRGPGTPLWVGVTKENGVWANIDGTFFSQSLDLFYSNEPNGFHFHAQMGYAKRKDDVSPEKLNDVGDDNRNRFVCEWCSPELATSTTTIAPSTTTTTAEPTTTTTTVPPTTTTTVPPTTSTTVPPTTTTTVPPTTATTAPPTTTTTAEPVTTTSIAPEVATPCPENLVVEADPNVEILLDHIKLIAKINSVMDNKKSGRTAAVKATCEDFCLGTAWGAACAPCGLHTFSTEAQCMFPGPFLTGELCHRNATSGEITDYPCCNAVTQTEKDIIDGYDLGKATTCVRGKQCNCKKWGAIDYKTDFHDQRRTIARFPASQVYTMPRKWNDESGCVAL